MEDNKEKIVVATRTDKDGLEKCIEKMNTLLQHKSVAKCYIIYIEEDNRLEKIKILKNKKPNTKPTRETAFNQVIDELRNDKSAEHYHLMTFSKEVEFDEMNINKMIGEIEGAIVVGYRLLDNVLSEEESKQFSNKENSHDMGIAYQVPWNTCALWNKEFVYGENEKKLIFDEICEDNQLGTLQVKVDNILMETQYKGMEDGLAIAKLVSSNENLKYKLINERLPWRIDEDHKRRMTHKIKMARKNIVLNKFIGLKGYSIDKLMAAKELVD